MTTELAIQGASNNAAAFREDVNGCKFHSHDYGAMARQVHSHHCGSGKAGSAGERVFDVTSGDTVLPKDFDILAEVGGLRKVATIVDLADAAVRGPLKIPFASSKGAGKFNTIKAARRPNRRLDLPHGLAEKVAKLKNATPAVLPLCLPANDHWN